MRSRSLKACGDSGSAGPLGKRELLMLRARNSSCAFGGDAGVAGSDFRPNHPPFDGILFVLICVCAVLRLRGPLGRSVKVGRYSITNSVSSFVGDCGTLSLTGADSPLNRSPNTGCRCGDFSLSVEGDVAVLNFGTNPAKDFARE